MYRAGDPAHPSLIVMPEIAGFAPGMRLFAERLVRAGFQVFVPWLFGPLGQRAPVRNAMRLCISREFACLRAGTNAPIASWLRALAAHVSKQRGDGRRIGAIGMCLTGAFAIPLILEPGVAAAVAAQPSVPLSLRYTLLGRRTSRKLPALNVSDQTIAEARRRLEAGEAALLAVRCRADRLCSPEKVERLRREFAVGLEVREYGDPDDLNRLGEHPHATFTKEYRLEPDAPSTHHSRQAFADLVDFFDRHLR